MSINRKFVIWILSFLVLIGSVAFYLHYKIMIKANTKDIESFGNTAVGLLEESLEDYMLMRNIDALQRTLNNLKNIQPVSKILLVNNEFTVKAASDREDIGTRMPFSSEAWFKQHEDQPMSSFIYEKKSFRLVSPVKNKPECYKCHNRNIKHNGYIVMYFSLTQIEKEARSHILYESYVFGGAFICLGFLLFALSKKLVSDRLGKVIAGLESFEKGNYEERMPVEGNDEITRLEKSLNQMAEAIGLRDKTLKGERDFSGGLIDSLPGIFYLFDDKGKMLRWNKALEDISGYSADEISKLRAIDFIAEKDRPLIDEKIQEVFVKGSSHTEAHFLSKKGHEIPFFFTGIRIETDSGKFLVGVGIDLTEREEAEHDRLEHYQRFKSLFDATRDGILVASGKVFVMANDAICRMLGYSRDEMLRLSVRDLHPEKEVPRILAEFEAHMRGETNVSSDIPVKRKDGSVFYADITSAPFSLAGENYVAGFFRDVTEKKESEEKLRQSEEKYRIVVENIREIIYMLALEDDLMRSRVIFVNGPTEGIIGYKPEEFTEDPELWSKLIHPDDRQEVFSATEKILTARMSGTREYRLRRKNSEEYLWLEDTLVPQINADGNIVGCFGVARDITSRKLAEQRIEAQVRRLQKLAEMSMKIAGDPVDVFNRIVGTIAELLNVPIVCLSEIRDKELYFLSVYNRGDIAANAGKCPFDVTPCATVEKHKDILVYHDVAKKFPDAELLNRNNIISYCGFPALAQWRNINNKSCQPVKQIRPE